MRKISSTKGNYIKQKKGASLIELLLYISLVSTVLFSVSHLLNVAVTTKAKNQTILEVEQQGNIVMKKILTAIKKARDINSPTPGNSASSISLSMPLAPSMNPTLINTSAENEIQIQEGPAAQWIPLTSNRVVVSNLRFENVSRPSTPDNIRVSFTLSYNNQSARNEFNYSQSFAGSANQR